MACDSERRISRRLAILCVSSGVMSFPITQLGGGTPQERKRVGNGVTTKSLRKTRSV
jgi:hypothetical protein